MRHKCASEWARASEPPDKYLYAGFFSLIQLFRYAAHIAVKWVYLKFTDSHSPASQYYIDFMAIFWKKENKKRSKYQTGSTSCAKR